MGFVTPAEEKLGNIDTKLERMNQTVDVQLEKMNKILERIAIALEGTENKLDKIEDYGIVTFRNRKDKYDDYPDYR